MTSALFQDSVASQIFVYDIALCYRALRTFLNIWIHKLTQTTSASNDFLTNGPPRPLFVYFSSFRTQILQKNNVGVSGIRTRIVRVEGEHPDHLTTTTAHQWRISYRAFNLFSLQSLAHEFGHNLKMEHDNPLAGGVLRKDSKGVVCTNIGSIMDYSKGNFFKIQ